MIEDIDRISFAYDIVSRAMSMFAKLLFCPCCIIIIIIIIIITIMVE